MVRCIAFLLALVAMASPALADEGQHQDELSDQQLGTVHFLISCAPGVQKTFERGVAVGDLIIGAERTLLDWPRCR